MREAMDGESDVIRALDWQIQTVQAQINEAKRLRDFQQGRINNLTRTRAELWKARRLQRQREAKAASANITAE